MTRLEQQIQFITEIDKVKNIYRQSYLADGQRKENDAEHSWHITLMAVLLQEYVPGTDLTKVMIMVLIHDLVEIDAGDTFAHLLDNFQPLLLNDASGGKSWAEHGVKKSQVYKRNEKIEETSEDVWKCMQAIVQAHIEKGNLKDE